MGSGRVAARHAPLVLGVAPVLQPYGTVRPGEAHRVAGGEDRGIGRAAVRIDDDPVVDRESGGRGQPIVGLRAGAHHDQVRRQALA